MGGSDHHISRLDSLEDENLYRVTQYFVTHIIEGKSGTAVSRGNVLRSSVFP